MQGKGLGAFYDIGELTMFADYRVPVVLRQLDILQYSPELAHKVLAGILHHVNMTCCCFQEAQVLPTVIMVTSLW